MTTASSDHTVARLCSGSMSASLVLDDCAENYTSHCSAAQLPNIVGFVQYDEGVNAQGRAFVALGHTYEVAAYLKRGVCRWLGLCWTLWWSTSRPRG